MPAFLTSPQFLTIAFGLGLTGLTLAILADHLQIIAKYLGWQNNRIAGGYNLAMKVMVVNRLGAVLYFLLIAFCVDNGLEFRDLAIGLALAILCIVPPTVVLLIWLQHRSKSPEIDQQIIDTRTWPQAIVLATFLATVFNLMGLTVPWIASAAYPELRLTLANTSFLFNTLFTVINVFYIEHKLSIIIDQGSERIHGFVSGVTFARLLAFFLVSAGLFVFSL